MTHTNDVVAARISAMSNGSRTDSAENMRSADRIGDAELVESSSKTNDSQKEGPSAKAIASDKSFLVADAEKQNAAIQERDEAKEPAKKSANKTRRRISSDRDRKFDPSREIRRTGEKITRVIRDIF